MTINHRFIAMLVSLPLTVLLIAPATAVDYYRIAPGGFFRYPPAWAPYYPGPSPPLYFGPGGVLDTANFALGVPVEARYTVTDVYGQNSQLKVTHDSLRLNLSDDYSLLNTSSESASIVVGTGDGARGDVIISGEVGAVLTSQYTIIGETLGAFGTVTADGLNWVNNESLAVGLDGSGRLNIVGGSDVSGRMGSIAVNTGAIVKVSGPGSTWTCTDLLRVGGVWDGLLDIFDGGQVVSGRSDIAYFGHSLSYVKVRGAGSTWDAGSKLSVGVIGDGNLRIEGGGRVVNEFGLIAAESGSNSTAVLKGAGSTWTNSKSLTIGSKGAGSLMIEGGGRVENTRGVLGEEPGSAGSATVAGAGSSWLNSESFVVGEFGTGELLIADGGSVDNATVHLGSAESVSGTATVTGAGSTWNCHSGVYAGYEGDAIVSVMNGGKIVSENAYAALEPTSHSTVTISGEGSNWTTYGDNGIWIGDLGEATLTIDAGGDVVTPASIFIGKTRYPTVFGTGSVLVSGAGSTLTGSRTAVGLAGTGTLTVSAGGKVNSGNGSIGAYPDSIGTATVTGMGSTWAMTGRLVIGGSAYTNENGGTGTLDVEPGGLVSVAEETILFSDGVLNLAGGSFATTTMENQGGDFDWTSGTLHVDLFNGPLTTPSGGTLAPGRSAGSTTILGDYRQESGAALAIEIGGLGTGAQYDFVDVRGVATLGGDLELSLINGFLPDPDDEFEVFNSDDLLGFFSNAGNGQRVNMVDGLGSFLVHYGPTSAFDPNRIVLTDFQQSAGLAGDFNGDGVVDGQDFLLWQRGESPNPFSTSDLADWRANYGAVSSLATSQSVPEPSLFALLGMASLGLIVTRLKARRN